MTLIWITWKLLVKVTILCRKAAGTTVSNVYTHYCTACMVLLLLLTKFIKNINDMEELIMCTSVKIMKCSCIMNSLSFQYRIIYTVTRIQYRLYRRTRSQEHMYVRYSGSEQRYLGLPTLNWIQLLSWFKLLANDIKVILNKSTF